MTTLQVIGYRRTRVLAPVVASATIGGAVTNHVVVAKRIGKPRQRRGVKKYRKDPQMRGGKAYKGMGRTTMQACVSFPPDELALLDQMATRCQMSRSHFIRQAVKHFGAKLFPDGALR